MVVVEDVATLKAGEYVCVWEGSGGQGGNLVEIDGNEIVIENSYRMFRCDLSRVRVEIEVPIPVEECHDYAQGDCQGEVDYSSVGNSKPYPRCEFHLDKRWKLENDLNERYPVNAPSDFSYLDAGEYWSEDDY
jgi:hypothetical protein